jgi:AraC family transcriptional regulator
MASVLIPSDRFPDLLPKPPEASAAWSVFSAYVIDPPARVSMACTDHLVSVLFSGTCRFREQHNGRSTEEWTGPGAVQVMPARFEGTWEGRDRTGQFRALALFIPHAFLARVATDWGVEPRSVELIHSFNTRDPVIESLFARLAHELRNGAPSGSIYAESACEFLVHHLLHAHSSLAGPPPRFLGGLPARRLKLVLDYIEEHLAQPITLRGLAELASVGPRHFERAFHQAVGVPPHSYLLHRRVTAARNLLVSEPRLPIHEIATRVGFSSSSHLASAFRRQTGQTPSEFRRSEAS